MTQTEIFKLLEENKGRKMTVREMRQILDMSQNSVSEAVKKMRKYNIIKFDEHPNSKQHQIRYRYWI